MLRIKLYQIVIVTTVVAVYCGALAAAARLIGGPTNMYWGVMARELFKLPLYILWVAVALVVFERRRQRPVAASCVCCAMMGFAGQALIAALMQIWLLSSVPNGGPSNLYYVWTLSYPVISFFLWSLLLFGVVSLMPGRSRPDEIVTAELTTESASRDPITSRN